MENRDCKNCKHYVLQNVKINLPGYPDTKYYGCESWECEFEAKEEVKDENTRRDAMDRP